MKSVKESIFPIILAFVIGNNSKDANWFDFFIMYGVPITIVLLTIINGVTTWISFTYWIENDELRIEHGVFIRKKRYIPFERIQSISVNEGVLQRLFGLAQITIETAGGGLGDPEVEMKAIKRQEAEELQRYIKNCKSQKRSLDHEQIATLPTEETSSPDLNKLNLDEPVHVIYKASLKNILFLALTSGGAIGVILAAIGFISQFDDLIPYEKLYTEARLFIASSIIPFVILILLIIIVAYLISIIQTTLKYYDYTVEKMEGNLIITHGLLERRKTTVPISRIQGMEIIENPFRKLLGYVTFQVINEGGTNLKENGKIMVCPLIKKQEIVGIVEACLPQYKVDVDFIMLPERAKIRYMLRPVYFIFPLVIVGAYLLRPLGLWLLLFIPLSIMFGYVRYRDAGWNLDGQQLTLRSRGIQTRTFFSLKNRIQALKISRNWFQRRKKLGTISSHVMSGSGRLTDMDDSDLKAIYHWYSRSEE